MEQLIRPKKIAFRALAALAIVLAVNAPSQARGMGGHSFGGGQPGGGAMHHGFEGHHVDRHGFDRDIHGRFGFGFRPIFPYDGYYPYYGCFPYYGYHEAWSYWYHCPSYGAYYPNVASCPEAWVTVPAS